MYQSSSKGAFYARVDMPGISKDEVKVWIEDGVLIFKGYGSVGSDLDNSTRRYGGRFLVGGGLKIDQVQYEMKNGVLRLCFPRVK